MERADHSRATIAIISACLLTTIAMLVAGTSVLTYAVPPAAGIAALVTAALAWRAPAITLTALVCAAPFAQLLSPGPRLYVANPWFELAWCGASAAWILRWLQDPAPLSSAINRWIVALWLLTCASAIHAMYIRHAVAGYLAFPPDLHAVGSSTFWAPAAAEAIRPAITLTEGVIAFVASRFLLSAADRTRVIRWWLIAYLAIAAVGIGDFLFIDRSSTFGGSDRAIAVFSGPNVFATYAAMGLPMAAYLWARGPRLESRLGAAATLLGALALWSSQSLGGGLALIVAGLIFATLHLPKRWWRVALGVTVLAIAVAAGVLSSLPWDDLNRLSHGRLGLWTAAWQMVESYPLSGVGLGNFYRDLPDFAGPGVGAAHEHAHNALVQIAAEQGLAILVLTLMVVLVVVRRIHWRPQSASDMRPAFALAVLAGSLHQLADNTMLVVTISVQLWFFVGCATARDTSQ